MIGRVDDMIISGGENIHPIEVEDVLAKYPKVEEVAVAGLPDDHWGEIVTAFVVRADESLTAEELDQYCVSSRSLANFKRPRKYVFVEQIPKSPVGKNFAPQTSGRRIPAGGQKSYINIDYKNR